MIKIAKWFNNYQAPSVLMIDDLSDVYIDVYKESYKNDWGYMCDQKGSAYHYLKNTLFLKFPYIKATFFVPYARHNVPNENSKYKIKKYALGERDEYTKFITKIVKQDGHEIAHHGSDHGEYIDPKNVSTANNFKHEWELFESVDEGVKTTLEGVKRFKEICDVEVSGGKFCGYKMRENSLKIIDECNFLYWSDRINFIQKEYDAHFFGKNKVISFPTNFSSNEFVRLSYLSGHPKRDKIKKILKYFQPLYSFLAYHNLSNLYKNGHIISIQTHISPSTALGTVQALNIVTDMPSLIKIYNFLSKRSIWYATCHDIAKYFYVRENSKISLHDNKIEIEFDNHKNYQDTTISIVHSKPFSIDGILSRKNNSLEVVNLEIKNGKNVLDLNLSYS